MFNRLNHVGGILNHFWQFLVNAKNNHLDRNDFTNYKIEDDAQLYLPKFASFSNWILHSEIYVLILLFIHIQSCPDIFKALHVLNLPT